MKHIKISGIECPNCGSKAITFHDHSDERANPTDANRYSRKDYHKCRHCKRIFIGVP